MIEFSWTAALLRCFCLGMLAVPSTAALESLLPDPFLTEGRRSVVGAAVRATSSDGDDSLRPQQASKPRVVILVPVASSGSWHDDAFLIAVPASVRAGGKPMVLAVDPERPWRPELLDFLRRYQPEQAYWLGESIVEGVPAKLGLKLLRCGSATEAAQLVARKFWTQAPQVVSYDPGSRGGALAAATLAARLSCPLLPRDAVDADLLKGLNTRRILRVGVPEGQATPGAGAAAIPTTSLAGAVDVVRWLVEQGHPVDYLAAVNPRHVGPTPKLSLAAVLLAAGRDGAIAALPYQTVWKRPYPTEPVEEAAPGAGKSTGQPKRQGTLGQGAAGLSFVTGQDRRTRRWWVQVDHNGDGDFGDQGEGPMHTGETLAFGDQEWVVDLDAEEKARGQSLWLTYPTPALVRRDLAPFRRAAGKEPQYLCVVGGVESIPMAIVSHGQGIDADLVSDLPYAQTDADPFAELAFGRFLAADGPSATLLACRGLAYADFPERSWERRFATAEWEGESRGPLERAGLHFAGHHPGGKAITADSPLASVNLIEHASHAMWTVLGKTYDWNSPVLLAPCLVDSAGCSTASLDQDAKHRSVAVQMLRNGAIAFVGNTRRGVAQQALFRSEFQAALLAGKTLGQAHRDALNRVMVAVLERGQSEGGIYYYQLYNHALYGDPALDLGWGAKNRSRSARVTVRGNQATVSAPARWFQYSYAPLPEWKCPFPQLHSILGRGMGIESSWYHPERRNEDVPFFTAEVRTPKPVVGIKPLDKEENGLGWTGRFFIDEHPDGSRSIFWRVRMVDFDMTTGKIRSQVRRLRYRLLRR